MSGLELRCVVRGGTVWLQSSGPALDHAFRLELRVDPPVRIEVLARTGLEHWQWEGASSADAAMHAVLLRSAGAQVNPEHLLARPIPGVAPEDIPSRPDRSAAWFRASWAASWRLHRGSGVGEAVGGFVSRHHRAILGEARRTPPADEDDRGDEVRRVIERLTAYCAATGRRPGRRSDPVRILAEARRWYAGHLHAQSPEGRLGAFLSRVPSLGLGPVVEIRELGGGVKWHAIGDVSLPPWAWPDGHAHPDRAARDRRPGARRGRARARRAMGGASERARPSGEGVRGVRDREITCCPSGRSRS